MHKVSQTYTFRDLPKSIISDESARKGFQRNIEKDIRWELELNYDPITSWALDVTGKDLLLTIEIQQEDARFLEIALHNLHMAKLINA